MVYITTRARVKLPPSLEMKKKNISRIHGWAIGCLSWLLLRKMTARYLDCIGKTCVVWAMFNPNDDCAVYINTYIAHSCIDINGIRRSHDDVIKWKHFPRYWPFVWGIHRSPVYSPHKGQWRGALMFYLICAWIYGWVNNPNLRHHRIHYDVTVMRISSPWVITSHSSMCTCMQYLFIEIISI